MPQYLRELVKTFIFLMPLILTNWKTFNRTPGTQESKQESMIDISLAKLNSWFENIAITTPVDTPVDSQVEPPVDTPVDIPVETPLKKAPVDKIFALPVQSFVDQSVTLAKQLSRTDVSLPIKLKEVRISLIDLKSSVMYSQIEEHTQLQLFRQIDDLKRSIASTTDEIYLMLASFSGALSKMEFYAENLIQMLRDESKRNDIVEKQFKDHLEFIDEDIERIIGIAEDVYSKLANVAEKTENLNSFGAKHKKIITEKLDQIENSCYISKLYQMTIGNGDIDKVKYQRNSKVLNNFPEFTIYAMDRILSNIDHLRRFKYEIDEIKFITSKMDRAQALPINKHVEILKNGLEKIGTYKRPFNRQLTQSNN